MANIACGAKSWHFEDYCFLPIKETKTVKATNQILLSFNYFWLKKIFL